MRVRAADEMRVGQAHQLDIVDVTALAGNETAVFLAHYACANAFNAHVLILPTGVIGFPRVPSKRVFNSEKGLAGGYSAACATFMRPAASSTALTMLW